MNKLVKGSIAGAAGIALLLGGGATLASWNSSIDAGAGSISAGTLDIQSSTTVPSGWTDQDGGAVDLTAYKIVPGDVLTYTATFDVTAIGDNLKATAAIADGSITAATTGNAAANAALAARLAATASYTVDGAPGATATITPSTNNVVVAVKITWADSTAALDNLAKNCAVDLSNFAITLNQTV